MRASRISAAAWAGRRRGVGPSRGSGRGAGAWHRGPARMPRTQQPLGGGARHSPAAARAGGRPLTFCASHVMRGTRGPGAAGAPVSLGAASVPAPARLAARGGCGGGRAPRGGGRGAACGCASGSGSGRAAPGRTEWGGGGGGEVGY
jgi:hypothetical protein